MGNLALAVRALRSRNYRLFFSGQIISLIGTWMTRIATSWLVYRLTDSAVLLGVVGFASQIPSFLLGPIAGVWVDRWDRHRTLVWTQSLSMIQYRTGSITYLDVVVAQTAELNAQVAALSVATRRLEASVDLVRSLGGGWSEAPPVTQQARTASDGRRS